MIKIGESVVYKGSGVFQISGTTVISGRAFIRLIKDKKTTILLPEDSINSDSVRGLASLRDIDVALKILQTPLREKLPKALLTLERILMSKLYSGSIFEVAEMVKIIFFHKKQRKLSVNEIKYFDSGMEHLVEEISAVCFEKAETVRDMILNRLNLSTKGFG